MSEENNKTIDASEKKTAAKAKSKKKAAIFCCVIAVVAVIAAVFILLSVNRDNKTTLLQSATASQNVSSNSDTNTTAYIQNTDEYEIKTSALTFYYPSKWQEYVTVKDNVKDGIGTIDFYASIGEHKNKLLFSFALNTDGDIPVGILTDDDNKFYISLTLASPEFDEAWSQNEKDCYANMQEDVNCIINSLRKLNEFVPNA